MRILGVIPARFSSTRFPGKPLALIGGKTMIERVYTQAIQSKSLEKVIVATDDQRIFDAVLGFGGTVKMTSAEHNSGTDRVFEIAEDLPGFDAYVNIQGDEPFIDPIALDQVCAPFSERDGAFVSTLIKRISDPSKITGSQHIKVTVGNDGSALYFSRNLIPHVRDEAMKRTWGEQYGYFKHIGIYGYSPEAIQEIRNFPPGPLEAAESLEQLRWLENGLKIITRETNTEAISIDTPEDLEGANQMLLEQ